MIVRLVAKARTFNRLPDNATDQQHANVTTTEAVHRDPAKSGEPKDARRPLRDRSDDRKEEGTPLGRRSTYQPEGVALDRAVGRGNAIVIAVRQHAQERLADGRRALQAINPHLMYAQRPAK